MVSGPAIVAADKTLMFQEAGDSGQAVGRLLAENRGLVRDLAKRLRDEPPAAVMTCARGSSDNAAIFGRYAIETRVGAFTGSVGLSVASIYNAPLRLPGGLCIAISQSGASPDLLAAVRQANLAGASTIAYVNAPGSPLAALATNVVDLCAGAEHSVAATKSFIASLAGLALLAAEWSEDFALLEELETLPALLDKAWQCDWSAALPILRTTPNCFILGRGPGLAIAMEAALKLKETCSMHAEGLSAAEVEHGPMALALPGFVVFAFAQSDESASQTARTVRLLVDRGVTVIAAGIEVPGALSLPTLDAHPLLQPILMIQTFYRLAAELSIARGQDPDRPPNLNKVTRTL